MGQRAPSWILDSCAPLPPPHLRALTGIMPHLCIEESIKKGTRLGPNPPFNSDVITGVKYALNAGAFYLEAQQVVFCKCFPLPPPLSSPQASASRDSSFGVREDVGEPGANPSRQGSRTGYEMSTVTARSEQKPCGAGSADPPPPAAAGRVSAESKGVNLQAEAQAPWFLRRGRHYYCCGCSSSNPATRSAC